MVPAIFVWYDRGYTFQFNTLFYQLNLNNRYEQKPETALLAGYVCRLA